MGNVMKTPDNLSSATGTEYFLKSTRYREMQHETPSSFYDGLKNAVAMRLYGVPYEDAKAFFDEMPAIYEHFTRDQLEVIYS